MKGFLRLRLVRIAAIAAAAAVCCLAVTGPTATGSPRPAPAPNRPSPDLQGFRLPPGTDPVSWRLLVIPVRFPEDADLGLSDLALRDRIEGDLPPGLRGYWLAATRNRLRIESTVAPLVVARHPRTWYTVEGEGNAGFGTDPDAYPHNARRLVEEVAAEIADRVDLARFDNDGDGIADGLLLVHSGPPAPEAAGDPFPRERLATHFFTLESPLALSSGVVFPYAVASARDAPGPWAHEVGHLLGLPDLYGTNPFFPGPGIGEWSLMATGANRQGGWDPSGLDAYSLQRLGFEGSFGVPPGADLLTEPFVRAWRKGEDTGAEFFLVERRTGADGLGLDQAATVLYAVDLDAGDMGDPDRPLVAVRGVICPGPFPCEVDLDDDSTPSLRDREGAPTGLQLHLRNALVKIGYDDCVILEEVRLGEPEPGPGTSTQQRVFLGWRNLGCDDAPREVFVEGITDPSPGIIPICGERTGEGVLHLIPPGEVRVDSSFVLRACTGEGPLPEVARSFEIRRVQPGTGTVTDTRVLATGEPGLPADSLAAFRVSTGSEDLWTLSSEGWSLENLPPLADVRLVSPWFTIPRRGQLLLDHAWALHAVPGTGLALDGAVIELLRSGKPDSALAPSLGWGFEVERNLGNPLAGRDVLAGVGDRRHVLALGALAGETVRLGLRAGGDFEDGFSHWRIREVSVAPGTQFTAIPVLQDPATGALGAMISGDAPLEVPGRLYSGPAGRTPRTLVESGFLQSLGRPDPAARAGDLRRVELIWRVGDAWGSSAAELRLPSLPVSTSFVATPNPIRAGDAQGWVVRIPDSGPFGVYTFTLFDVRGRQVRTLRATWETAGARDLPWDGRDSLGRTPAAGVYLLQCKLPDGDTRIRKVVVLP